MSDLRQISEQTANILPMIGTPDFVSGLVEMLRCFVPIDEACMIVYPESGAPYIDHREMPFDTGGLETYLTGPFLLDPYYVAVARESRYGFFTLKELAPRGFRSSEYYRIYYRFSGVFDECGYLVSLGSDSPGDTLPGAFINLSLARTGDSPAFERRNLNRLKELCPLVTSLVQQHFLIADSQPSIHLSLRSQLESCLADFGTSVLTPREQQIITAVLHGHTSKALAIDLGISVETVKLHRKNAYRKLEVRNQTELFHTFIQTLGEQP